MKQRRPLSKRVVYLVAVASVLFAAYVLVPAAGHAGRQEAEQSQTGAAKGAPTKPRNDLAGLPNFAQVSDAVYRGAQPGTAGFKELKKLGVKTIVNLRSVHSDAEAIKGLGFNYVQIRMNYLDPQDEQVAAFLKVATDPVLQPVFVHCKHGADRTGTMVAAYRIVVQGWDRAAAAAELPVFGFHGLWQSLKGYLEELDARKIKELMKQSPMPKVKRIE